MYHRSCLTVYESKKKESDAIWEKGFTEEAKLYRAVRDLKMPMQKRAVPADASGVAHGFSYGLTVGSNRQPYIPSMPNKVRDIVRIVKSMLEKSHPEFRFTSLQILLILRVIGHGLHEKSL